MACRFRLTRLALTLSFLLLMTGINECYPELYTKCYKSELLPHQAKGHGRSSDNLKARVRSQSCSDLKRQLRMCNLNLRGGGGLTMPEPCALRPNSRIPAVKLRHRNAVLRQNRLARHWRDNRRVLLTASDRSVLLHPLVSKYSFAFLDAGIP
jgi:ribosomal protein L39E